MSVLLGQGDGSFQTARTFPAGDGPTSVAVGDLDGDGHLDLLAVARSDNGRVFLGQGDGSWNYGFLFAPALTVGGGTSEVQRNIISERVLGLPHDPDVEVGKTWSEARR